MRTSKILSIGMIYSSGSLLVAMLWLGQGSVPGIKEWSALALGGWVITFFLLYLAGFIHVRVHVGILYGVCIVALFGEALMAVGLAFPPDFARYGVPIILLVGSAVILVISMALAAYLSYRDRSVDKRDRPGAVSDGE